MPSRRNTLLAYLPSLISVAAFLLAWKAAASAFGADIILPPPERVLAQFIALLATPKFLTAIGMTCLRCLIAFALSLGIGLCLGVPAGLSGAFRALLAPFLAIVRSTPVLAIIVLLLIWFPQDAVPVVSALLMAAPVLISSLSEGIRSVDGHLIEMAQVHRLPRPLLLGKIYLPSLAPFAVSGASAALSLVWKVVVAGEVLSQPRFAIGTGLQGAKMNLETAQALAWTLATVILCGASDYVFSRFAGRIRHAA
jgi:NitT/TauT family transport system permease protein